MRFYSTKDKNSQVALHEAIFRGMPADKGLYMPEQLPIFPSVYFSAIQEIPYHHICFELIMSFLGEDLPAKEMRSIIEDSCNFPVKLVEIEKDIYTLELFHGPTLSFKDFGARFMARMISYYLQEEEGELTILVATSGDTGSAVGRGFFQLPRVKVKILYPKDMVTEIQEKQITTIGDNVQALEIEGSFDDCQKLVKMAFVDEELRKKVPCTSANSINIARLLPQMFYYFYGYGQLKNFDLPVVVSVPSGNFGNLCAGLIAKRCGLPIEHFVASTNVNDVVPQYLAKGLFTSRASVTTLSNAMDVGNPSNFGRMLDLYDNDLEKMRRDIYGAAFTDEETKKIMVKVKEESGYLMDPHGAVGYLGLKQFMEKSEKPLQGIFLETAHPAKFLDLVEPIIQEKVEVPQRLEEVLKKEKVAVKLPADYSAFRDYLMGS